MIKQTEPLNMGQILQIDRMQRQELSRRLASTNPFVMHVCIHCTHELTTYPDPSMNHHSDCVYLYAWNETQKERIHERG